MKQLLLPISCVATFAVALASASCSSGGTVTGTGGSAASTTKCGALSLTNRSTSCASCVDTSCCSMATTCGQATGCQAIVTCELSCGAGDTACLDKCGNGASADAANAYNTLLGCVQQSCSSQCTATTSDGGTSSGSSGSSGSTSNCTSACLTNGCSAQISACQQDQTCTTAATCVSNCTTSACEVSCYNAANGNAATQAYFSCADQSCGCFGGQFNAGTSTSGGSSSGGNGAAPASCLENPPAGAVTCSASQPYAHDCPNGTPAGYTCTPVPGVSGVYCCDQ